MRPDPKHQTSFVVCIRIQNTLRALWYATYPGQELQSLVTDQWKEMGWQGKDPSTDFRINRGACFISLENLRFFAKTLATSFQSLLRKKTCKRVVWEYPFVVAARLLKVVDVVNLMWCRR